MTVTREWSRRAYTPCAGCGHSRVRHARLLGGTCTYTYVIYRHDDPGHTAPDTRVCDCPGFTTTTEGTP